MSARGAESRRIRVDERTWRRLRLAATTEGATLGEFLAVLMDGYDRQPDHPMPCCGGGPRWGHDLDCPVVQ